MDWIGIPRLALIDALRNVNVGPANISRQDKGTLVGLAEETLGSEKADAFRCALEREIAVRRNRRL